jgi:hypothetical protein
MKSLLTASLLAAGALFTGCGAIDAAVDCQGICSRYQSCFDNDYDVTSCADRCRNNAGSDTDYKRKADVCNACISNRSCSGATFNCASECASIVP